MRLPGNGTLLLRAFAKAAGPAKVAKKLGLADVKHIIAVTSAKGGVGKSTCAGRPADGREHLSLLAARCSLLIRPGVPKYPNSQHCLHPAQCCPGHSRTLNPKPLSVPHIPQSAVPSTLSPYLYPAVNIAAALSTAFQQRVGLLDADIHGPSIPKMMNLAGQPDVTESGWLRQWQQ